MEYRARASREQFRIILEFMERHGDITSPSQPGALGRLRNENLWLVLSDTLNSAVTGVSRTPGKWRKVWADWKLKTKRKATVIQMATEAGVGRSHRIKLTRLEKRLLNVVAKKTANAPPTLENEETQLPPLMEASTRNENGRVDLGAATEFLFPSSPLSSYQREPSPAPVTPAAEASGRRQRARWASPTPAGPSSSRHQTPTPTTSSPQPLGARLRMGMTTSDREFSYMALEHRRLRLEEIKERNKARRIKVELERNVLLNRFADIAEAMLVRMSGDNNMFFDSE